MLRNTGNTDALIVEYGFLDSKGDDVNQLKDKYLDYAEAVVRAIAEYLNIPYTDNITNNDNGRYIVKAGDTIFMGNNE